MEKVKISDTDENADWIKSLSDDVKVSEMAKRLLKEKAEILKRLKK